MSGRGEANRQKEVDSPFDVVRHDAGTGILARLKLRAFAQSHNFHFLRRIQWQLIERYLKPGKGEKILDVASGNGFYSEKMAKRGATVTGIDMDPVRIEHANTFHNAHGVVYDLGKAEDLPYPDASFDKVVSVCALEHFNDPQKAVTEMGRVLKPGGTLVLDVDSFSYREIDEAVRERHRKNYFVNNYFTHESLGKIHQKAGLRIVEHCYSFYSKQAHKMYLWSEERGHTGWAFLLMFPVGYLMCKLGDKLSKTKHEGYDLYTKAVKPL
jgi:ubiquinone/menaquinone biosynthesis C-methylase UbiE